MVEPTSLDSILDEKPPEKEAPPESAPQAEQITPPVEDKRSTRAKLHDKEQDARAEGEGKVRDPVTGQFVAKPEAKVEPEKKEEPAKPVVAAPLQFSDKERAFLAAAEDERRKRQALEQEIAALKAAKPTEPPKTFWDDPEGVIKSLEAKSEQQILKTKVDLTESFARSQHTDYDAKVAVFVEVAKVTPGLYQQMIASPNPAEFAYRIGKNHAEIREAGSIDNLRAKIEQEVRTKLEAELRTKHEALEKDRAALPSSLSDVRGTTVHKPVWGGPPSLDDILKG